MRMKIVNKLKLRYANAHQDKQFALAVCGVNPYDPVVIQSLYDKYEKVMSDGSLAPEVKTVELQKYGCVSTVVSGVQVSWKAAGVLNTGYIKTFAEEKLPHWDSTIERKAGGLDPNVTLEAQHFHLTSSSSILALCAQALFLHCYWRSR